MVGYPPPLHHHTPMLGMSLPCCCICHGNFVVLDNASEMTFHQCMADLSLAHGKARSAWLTMQPMHDSITMG